LIPTQVQGIQHHQIFETGRLGRGEPVVSLSLHPKHAPHRPWVVPLLNKLLPGFQKYLETLRVKLYKARNQV
ncbi:hypothetical protein, partial [Rothia mucilaginosa]|uniref:hypothetical protein n=1 Tax=Rothia mucilaginosa TaxID=43675 RepID=UPI0026F080E2